MKLLFVYGEEKVKQDEKGQFYSTGTLPLNVWKNRYLLVSNDIVFMARKDEKIYDEKIAKKNYHLLDSKIKYIELLNLTKNIKSFISLSNRKILRNKIEEEILNADCILVRIPSKYSYYAIDLALKYNKKIIAEVVGCAFDSNWNYGLVGKILAIPCYLELKKNVKKLPNIIYVSQIFLQKRYPTYGNVLSCSDVEIHVNDNDINIRKEKIEKFNINDKIILGSCGAIDMRYKGYQYVIKAIYLLKKQYNLDIEYNLIGAGNQKFLLKIAKKYHVEKNISFLGAKSHEQVVEFMKKMDIYIQPSNADAIPRVVLEAMSTGCPCIGSNVGGIPELIDKKYIFKKKNTKDLAKKIINLLLNKNEMLSQAITNFENSRNYNSEILNKTRIDFMNDVYNNDYVGGDYDKR